MIYHECYELAKLDYTSTGATLSGFGTGFLFGLIGTGVPLSSISVW